MIKLMNPNKNNNRKINKKDKHKINMSLLTRKRNNLKMLKNINMQPKIPQICLISIACCLDKSLPKNILSN